MQMALRAMGESPNCAVREEISGRNYPPKFQFYQGAADVDCSSARALHGFRLTRRWLQHWLHMAGVTESSDGCPARARAASASRNASRKREREREGGTGSTVAEGWRKTGEERTCGCGSKPMVPFWDRCTTHLRTYFILVGIGIFTGGMVWGFDPWPCRVSELGPGALALACRCPQGAPRTTKFVPHSIEDQVRLAYNTPASHVGASFAFVSFHSMPFFRKAYHPTDPRHPDIAEPGAESEPVRRLCCSTLLIERTHFAWWTLSLHVNMSLAVYRALSGLLVIVSEFRRHKYDVATSPTSQQGFCVHAPTDPRTHTHTHTQEPSGIFASQAGKCDLSSFCFGTPH